MSSGGTVTRRGRGRCMSARCSDCAQNFTREVAAGERQGQVLVNLVPAGIGGWRFVGEQQWRASGVAVTGLTTGDREIEYRPVAGYIQPRTRNRGHRQRRIRRWCSRRIYYQFRSGRHRRAAGSAGAGLDGRAGACRWRAAPNGGWWAMLIRAWRDSGAQVTGLMRGQLSGGMQSRCPARTRRHPINRAW